MLVYNGENHFEETHCHYKQLWIHRGYNNTKTAWQFKSAYKKIKKRKKGSFTWMKDILRGNSLSLPISYFNKYLTFSKRWDFNSEVPCNFTPIRSSISRTREPEICVWEPVHYYLDCAYANKLSHLFPCSQKKVTYVVEFVICKAIMQAWNLSKCLLSQ